MSFWHALLNDFHMQMDAPTNLSLFHIFWFAASFLILIPLLRHPKNHSHDHVRRVVLVTSVIVLLLEVYKQITYSFLPENEFAFDYQWYAFPFQFCSTPMYIGLLAGLIKKGKVHDCLCAYLATFSIFAGLAVMIYPGNVFCETLGINIQTMICHGSMLTIGIYLFATGHVKLSHKTILKALPVFAITVGLAMIMNEVVYRTNLTGGEEFTMFYISPYFLGDYLPIYSAVHRSVPFPLNILIYIVGFTAAAYIILLLAMLIGLIVRAIARKVRKPVAV